MKNHRIIQMSIHAMFIGLMTLMTFVPQIGFIALSPFVAFTLLHIPVLFGAVLFGWKAGLFYGVLFGALSFFRALVSPVGFLDPFFVDPIISVVPRAIFGLGAGLLFDLAKLIKKNLLSKLAIAGGSVIMTIVHSLLVLLLLGMIYAPTIEADATFLSLSFNTYWLFMGFIILTNGIPEAILAGILVPILALAISRYPRFALIANAFKKEKQNNDTNE